MAWTFAARTGDVAEGVLVAVTCNDQPLALYRQGGEYFAFLDRCPHQGAPLSEGCIVEGFIECPRHYALFDIRTGESGGGVTMNRARTYATRIVDDAVEVELDTD